MKAFPLFRLVLAAAARSLSAPQSATAGSDGRATERAGRHPRGSDARRHRSSAASRSTRRKRSWTRMRSPAAENRRRQRLSGKRPGGDEPAANHHALQRQSILQQKGDGKPGEGGVSFLKDVVPILKDKCGNCHSNNPRANLRLDTFAGMKQPGRSGPLLTVGNPNRSLLIAKLTAPPNQRMPRNSPASVPQRRFKRSRCGSPRGRSSRPATTRTLLFPRQTIPLSRPSRSPMSSSPGRPAVRPSHLRRTSRRSW